jgi:hypothetical protein
MPRFFTVTVASLMLLAALLLGGSPVIAAATPGPAEGLQPAQAAAIAAPRISVCDYATSVGALVFVVGFGVATLDPTSGVPLPAGDTPEGLLAQFQQAFDGVKALPVPDGYADYNATVMGAFQTLLDALPAAVAALNAGDNAQAHMVVEAAGNAFQATITQLGMDQPDLNAQLDACG